jgi:hypothetical protein
MLYWMFRRGGRRRSGPRWIAPTFFLTCIAIGGFETVAHINEGYGCSTDSCYKQFEINDKPVYYPEFGDYAPGTVHVPFSKPINSIFPEASRGK